MTATSARFESSPDGAKSADPKASDPILNAAGDLRVVLAHLSRRLREQTPTGNSMLNLTRSQSSVLSRIEREGQATMSGLAQAEGMRPQSMSAIVSALVAADLIAGSPDPSDGRKTVLSLTSRAREAFDTGRVAKVDWLFQAIRTGLNAAEQRELESAIELLRKLALSP